MARKASTEAALEQAQDLIYDAWEAGTAKQRIALAKKALAINPLCADAYNLLAEHAEPGSDERLEFCRRALEAGAAALGEAGFKEFAGYFWQFLETRPYMRALHGLALILWQRGVQDEAVSHLYEMLRLNPNDNQGARYMLAEFLLEADRDDELAALLQQYPDDGAAAWSWTSALAAFRRSGDSAESRNLLAQAITDNEHVPAYLIGRKKLPRNLSAYVGLGDEDEAVDYVEHCRAGWQRTPGSLDWLAAHATVPKKRKSAPRH